MSTTHFEGLDNYFDHIYVLNLDRRPDRWITTRNKLEMIGCSFDTSRCRIFRFSATDGQQGEIIQAWRKLPYFLPNSGTLAILFSIQRILKDADANKWNRFLILEDDVIFHRNFKLEWSKKIKTIPDHWKLLFLGNSMHRWRFRERAKIHPAGYLTCRGAIPGAFALGIDRSVIGDLWRGILTGKSPWDINPLKQINTMYPGKCIVLHPPLCIAGVEDSDLRDRDMNQKAADCGWDLKQFY